MSRGRPRKRPLLEMGKCFYCGRTINDTNTWKVSSDYFRTFDNHVHICKDCIDNIYEDLCEKYSNPPYVYLSSGIDADVERHAIRRICSLLDIYYTDKVFDLVLKDKGKIGMMSSYMRLINLRQHKGKTYDDTIAEDEELSKRVINTIDDLKSENSKVKDLQIKQKTVKFFGTGFSDEDYDFLQNEYNDWTARHECKTKAQEEIIKDICFNRLQNLKAQRKGLDTKDITSSFQKLLDSGKLQPKQNASDTLAETQTFGTLIDKWENTRPIPEIDEDLKDVDKIGLYLDTFFKGHLAKAMGLKNGVSRLYDKNIKKYTVSKPEYEDEEDNEALFDAIFGNPKNLGDD